MQNVAVLGLGSIGLRHARNLLSLGVRVVGYDPDLSRQAAARAIGVEQLPRSEALAKADAVVVASPSRQHLADLRDSAANGRPVFVEKPIGHDVDGLRVVAKAATAPIFPALILRHDAAVQAASRFLSQLPDAPRRATVVCESFLPDWRPGTDYTQGYAADPVYGGVLFDHIHEVDLAWHLLGPLRLQSAKATRSGLLNLASEDRVEFNASHASGEVRVIVDYGVPTEPRRQTHICGHWGRLTLDILARKILIEDPIGTVVREERLPGDNEQDYVDQMREFLEVAAERQRPRCSVEEAIDVLQFTLNVRRLCALPNP